MWRRWIRRCASALCLLLALGYVGVLAKLWLGQEGLIFHPEALAPDYRFELPADTHEVTIDVPGARLNALHMRLPHPRGIVFYLHGNAGNLSNWFVNGDFYRALNMDLFMLDYRGFGKSTGHIESEAQMLADVQAAWASIAPMYKGLPVVFVGRSLGTGLATSLAASLPPAERPALLALVSPYSSMAALATEQYPFVPAFLLRYPLHTDEALERLAGGRTQVLLLHGEQDTLIPIHHSEALSRIAPNVTLVRVPGAGHNDIQQQDRYRRALSQAIDAVVSKS